MANIFLAGFKAFIGLASKSIAITMDAVNNLSDALSSIITIIGTKLAAKAPDKKHPLGHGRIEYISTMVIAVIILYAGVTAFIESVKKILHPEVPEYKVVSLIIIVVAITVKIVLGTYVKKTGKKSVYTKPHGSMVRKIPCEEKQVPSVCPFRTNPVPKQKKNG